MDVKLPPARTILVLAIGLFVCFWIFIIGVLVGRGTSPVTFDTREFQDSLARIVSGSEDQQEPFEKPEMEFYEVLKSPARTGGSTSEKHSEIFAAGVEKASSGTDGGRRQPAVKKSLKAQTFRPGQTVKIKSPPKAAPVPKKTVVGPIPKKGAFTIQIAAFKELKDANALMGKLREKGFQSHRTMGQVGNDIWHRVRTGSFKDMASAKQVLQRLNEKRFKGMIIKKE